MSKALIVIGPEGSLIHMSTTIGVPTIVVERGRSFNNYSSILKENIIKIDQITPDFIDKSLGKILNTLIS